MSSKTRSIDPFHPTVPILRVPSQTEALEEEIFQNVLEGKIKPIPLKIRVKSIPRKFLDLFKDAEWMSLIVDSFGIASRSLELVGSTAGHYVPYLSIASSPFYLYHALKHSKERLKLMFCAARTARVADAFFWLGRGIDSIGTALSDISKPFAGGFELGSLATKHFALGIAFTLVIPIILIVFGAFGGFSKGWAMIRTRKVLKRFNQEVDKQDGSLKALAETLEYLQGPQLVSMNPEKHVLEEKFFNENHFTNDRRREAVQARINALMNCDLHEVHSMVDYIASQEVKAIIPELTPPLQLMQDIQELHGQLATGSAPDFLLLDKTLDCYESLLIQLDKSSEIYQEVEYNRGELLALKKEILEKGGEIIRTTRSEIHRNLCYHAFFILMAAITLAAGVLLLYPGYAYVGYGLALVSSSLNVLYILFEKKVSQESFYKMERYLQNVLEKKLESDVQ